MKARNRVNIMKYIAGRDWGVDAVRLRTTYNILIRLILEFGFFINCCAFDTILKKLGKVQLIAASIVTGMRCNCSSDILIVDSLRLIYNIYYLEDGLIS